MIAGPRGATFMDSAPAAGPPPPSPALSMSSDLYTLADDALERFLERQKASASLPAEVRFGPHLREILEKAAELVPSESGSILLDDPRVKGGSREANTLCFVASFGPAAAELPGQSVPARQGIVGRVYRTGTPHLSEDVARDESFSAEVDRRTGHHTTSVVAVPIAIGRTVCGVMELVNRLDGEPFTRRDLALLQIFADYTSSALQNALDAKRARELAKRDDLTGLSNDRWLHVRLAEILEESEAGRTECALIFLDLDGFKAVNDTHGHLAGSQVLREVGFLLRRVVPDERAVVARYGGDEFVVGLPRAGLEEGVRVAEQIRAGIAGNTFLERDHGAGVAALHLRGVISASVGVASHLPGRDTGSVRELAGSLLRRADTAMYAAKARGKNCVVVDETVPVSTTD